MERDFSSRSDRVDDLLTQLAEWKRRRQLAAYPTQGELRMLYSFAEAHGQFTVWRESQFQAICAEPIFSMRSDHSVEIFAADPDTGARFLFVGSANGIGGRFEKERAP